MVCGKQKTIRKQAEEYTIADGKVKNTTKKNHYQDTFVS
jgi:hypothetical protein